MRNAEILHDWIDCLRWRRSPGPNIVGPEREDPFPSCFWVSSKSWAVLRAQWGMPPPCQAPFHSSTQTAALATPEAARRITIIMQTEEKALMNTPGTWGSYRQGFLGSWIHTALSGRREEEGGWVSGGLSLWAHRYFLWGMLQPKAYRSGASKYRGLGQAPWIAGWQYCQDNFFSGLEMYFLHNLSLLYILSCYFPSFSFLLFLTILQCPFFLFILWYLTVSRLRILQLGWTQKVSPELFLTNVQLSSFTFSQQFRWTREQKEVRRCSLETFFQHAP